MRSGMLAKSCFKAGGAPLVRGAMRQIFGGRRGRFGGMGGAFSFPGESYRDARRRTPRPRGATRRLSETGETHVTTECSGRARPLRDVQSRRPRRFREGMRAPAPLERGREFAEGGGQSLPELQ